MQWMTLSFPVSGVEIAFWLPPLVGLMISFICSLVGISGAFLLLPFQLSVLNFTSPSVSATNLVFNLVAIPSGVWRYIREGRMAWSLSWIIVLGTLPGIVIGFYLRVWYLPDPEQFKIFAGCVLLYVGYLQLAEFSPWKIAQSSALEQKFSAYAKHSCGISAGLSQEAKIKLRSFSLLRAEYEFWGESFSFSTLGLLLMAFLVGTVSGTYGIGGGAIIAPFCVAIFRIPVYVVAGAALASTLVTSIAGVILYSLLPAPSGLSTQPDWALGILFGSGGIIGMYLGARCQKFIPQKILKLLMGGLLVAIAIQYFAASFL